VQERPVAPSEPGAADPRTPAARAADHAAVARLADTLLPALMAKLGASHLGELEVREGEWHVRLRRPAAGAKAHGAAAGSAGAGAGSHAAAPGKARVDGHAGHLPGAGEVHAPGHAPQGPSAAADDPAPSDLPTATAPAVGVFQAGRGGPGTAVKAGDRVAVVDVLGVPADVLAPVDGRVAEVLVESGTGVEYGQPLVRIEPAAGAR
jgi:acetyl-CoA carboxylase biotin carboxyl carrier protein